MKIYCRLSDHENAGSSGPGADISFIHCIILKVFPRHRIRHINQLQVNMGVL